MKIKTKKYQNLIEANSFVVKQFFLVILFFFTAVLAILEIKFNLQEFLFITTFIYLPIGLFFAFLPTALQNKIQKISQYIFLLFLLATLINLLFKIVNPYELANTPEVESFCYSYLSLCTYTVKLFYLLKLYRFITLSSSFFVAVLTLFSIPVLLHHFLKKSAYRFKKKDIPFLIVILSCLWILIFNFQVVLSAMINQTIKASLVWNLPLQERWVIQKGGNQAEGWIYTYAQFIKKHTPEDAIIFIPPQRESWKQEGNAGYLRWFVFPRKLVQRNQLESEIPQEATHVLIAHGNWIWFADEYTWPRITIPASQISSISLIDRKTLEEETFTTTTYTPFYSEEVWGIIELKNDN